jgi:hypothetical protein
MPALVEEYASLPDYFTAGHDAVSRLLHRDPRPDAVIGVYGLPDPVEALQWTSPTDTWWATWGGGGGPAPPPPRAPPPGAPRPPRPAPPAPPPPPPPDVACVPRFGPSPTPAFEPSLTSSSLPL